MARTLVFCVAVLVVTGVAVAAIYWYRPTAAEMIPSHGALRPDLPSKATAVVAPSPPPTKEMALPAGVQVKFVDVTSSSGIQFQHFDGRTPMEYIMDQTGSGLAWLDYDQDGWLDLFLVQGSAFQPPFPSPPPTCKLFRNQGNGRFREMTPEVGLAHVGCGQGVAVGDIDNDGYPDLFLTNYGKPNVLYHNRGVKHERRFVDSTTEAGMADHPAWHERPNFSTSAAFLDFNRDGWLDLFVCSYVKIDLDHYPDCRSGAGQVGPCPPARFEGTRCVLYQNNGNGTFRDISKEAGIDQPGSKALGVIALDLDDDGLTDIFVANDTMPNFLFRNLGNGRFQSIGPMSGCAVNLDGTPQAYMGVDADDLDGDGRPDLYVTAFAREYNTLFRNEGRCQFLDVTHAAGLGPPSWFPLSFGTCFLDVDRDGNLDIVVANGHVSRNVDREGDANVTFRQSAQLYLNHGQGRFREITSQCGPYFQEKHVGRGVALCDYDNDGRQDLAFANSGEAAVLLHNESGTPYHWLRLDLEGTRSNRDAVGARVSVQVGNRRLVRHRKGGGSYLSTSDPRLLIGVGAATRVDSIEVRWPSGLKELFGPADADQAYRLVEGTAAVTPAARRP